MNTAAMQKEFALITQILNRELGEKVPEGAWQVTGYSASKPLGSLDTAIHAISPDGQSWSRHFNPDKTWGGWVRDDSHVEPGATVRPGAIVCGRRTFLDKDVLVADSLVGPNTLLKPGTSVTNGSIVHGDHSEGDHFWPNRTVAENSRIAGGRVFGSRLKNAEVSDGALVNRSRVEDALVSGQGTHVHKRSEVLSGAKVTGGAHLMHSKAENGGVVDGPHTTGIWIVVKNGSQLLGGVSRNGTYISGEVVAENNISGIGVQGGVRQFLDTPFQRPFRRIPGGGAQQERVR
ncbi:MAG: hypothetical protein PW734_02045 [Verrucomicrobium sp.]|nr:hypothetical protein [Verrucomicrobium sp.]